MRAPFGRVLVEIIILFLFTVKTRYPPFVDASVESSKSPSIHDFESEEEEKMLLCSMHAEI